MTMTEKLIQTVTDLGHDYHDFEIWTVAELLENMEFATDEVATTQDMIDYLNEFPTRELAPIL